MKFTDGFWLLKHGVRPYYALQVVQSTQTENGFDFQVSTRPVKNRGDTLGGPLLTVKMSAPTEGVIGVKLTHSVVSNHFPEIPLFPDAKATPKVSIHVDETLHTIKSGDLKVEATPNPYTLMFSSDSSKSIVTKSGSRYSGLFDVPWKWTQNSATNATCLANDTFSNPSPQNPPPSVKYINTELDIAPGELFYGAGETFGTFTKNGQSISMWNQDGGTSSDQAYKCVPFLLSNRGYGIFVNHPGEVELEVGSAKVSRLGISVADESLEYFIIAGNSPLQASLTPLTFPGHVRPSDGYLKVLERYTQMTGRPALPPSWTFGLWLSTSFLTNYDSSTVSGFLQGMQDRKCYVRVFHFDCFWMKQYEWCSFTFDPENFPDPKRYLAEIKTKYNVKICVWINPYISQYSPIFQEAAQNGYLIKRTNGLPWQWDLWQPGLGIVDLTDPDAREWYANKLRGLLELGVDCFKTDFGERIPHVNVQFHDGSDTRRMHNMYSVLYNELVFKVLKDRFGEHEAVVFARASAVGGQRFPVHWGGDCESTYEAMAEAMRGALSLTLSGFGFASHDIGGFEGTPPADIYNRWVAFGLFSTHSRLHGSESYRVPWADYGEVAANTLAKFVDAKHRLMPYIFKFAIEAHLTGRPLMRAMILEFPEDRTTHHLDQQFMLGPSLLIAPSFVPDNGLTEYYLPSGRWTSFFDPTRVVQGPRWMKERIGLDDICLWVRESTVLALGPSNIKRPDYPYGDAVELRVYEAQPGFSMSIAIPSGNTTEIAGMIDVTREGNYLYLKAFSVSREIRIKSIEVFESGSMFTESVTDEGKAARVTIAYRE